MKIAKPIDDLENNARPAWCKKLSEASDCPPDAPLFRIFESLIIVDSTAHLWLVKSPQAPNTPEVETSFFTTRLWLSYRFVGCHLFPYS